MLVTGYDLGVAHDGGYAGYVRVPGRLGGPGAPRPHALRGDGARNGRIHGWSLSRAPGAKRPAPGEWHRCRDRIHRRSGQHRRRLRWHVLGTTSTAITGKDDAHEYLRQLGAREVLSRTTLEMGTRPLEKARWAGAIDAVGGDTLAWLTRTTDAWGGIASTGLTGGVEVHTTVMPFILRGVSLIGIDSVTCPMAIRTEVWRRLATDMKPQPFKRSRRRSRSTVSTDAFATLLSGKARGRFVVNLRSGET